MSSGRRPVIAAGVVVVALIGYGFSADLGPFIVNGISDGSIYALAALGLVLTYKTSGIFNFAIGAQAAASGYVFHSFRDTLGLQWPLAALITLVLVGIGGACVLERLAFLLAEAPPVMKVAAAIGLLVLLRSVLTGAYGAATLQFQPFLPTSTVGIAGVRVQYSQLIVAALAILATAGLYAFFRTSRRGLAMQAVVDDPSLLALQATSPITTRRWAWGIGSAFVSVSGMLIAPELGVSVDQTLLLYVTAFGAAALGGFSSLPITFCSALGIGIVMNVLSDKLASQTDAVLNQLYTQVPFLVLVAALLFVPRASLIERGTRQVRRLAAPRQLPKEFLLPAAVLAVVAAVALPDVVRSDHVNQFTTGLGFAVVLASLALLLWTSGQISLCQLAFAAVGATTFAHAQHAGFPWLVALLVAGAVAVPVGALVSIPSFRLSGTYLAVATFGFGLLFQNLVYVTGLMFGGSDLLQLHRPRFPGLDTQSDKGYYYLTLTVALAVVAVVLGIRGSRLGRLLRGLSDSPTALQAHAVDTRVTQLSVFGASAFLAAIGGALIAGVTQSASGVASGSFGYFNSLVLVAVLVFCGRRPVVSPVLAAFLFEVLKIYAPFTDSFFVNYQGAIFGALAILVAAGPALRPPSPSPFHGRRSAARLGRSTTTFRLEVRERVAA